MKDMMPWVIGAVVAYLGWEYMKKQNIGGGVWNEGAITEQVKYPEGGTGYAQYSYPANVVL